MSLIFLICSNLSSQIFKNTDTIYVCFKKDQKNQQYYSRNDNSSKKKYEDFIFLSDSWNPLNLSFHHYPSQEIRKVRKSFLKKIKGKVINYEFLIKLNLAEITELLSNIEKIYLIEENKISFFNLKLKEVQFIGLFKHGVE